MDQFTSFRSRIDAVEQRLDFVMEDMRQLRESLAAEVYLSWNGLRFSRSESTLVAALSDGKIWTVDRLIGRLDALHPRKDNHDMNIVRVHIFRIRAKLKAVSPPMQIEKVPSVGYQLAADSVTLLTARKST